MVALNQIGSFITDFFILQNWEPKFEKGLFDGSFYIKCELLFIYS